MLGSILDAESPPKQTQDELPDIEETFEDLEQTVDLPYSLDLCLEMWRAFVKFGVMAKSGGYLDQPRKWHRMIRLFNSRQNAVVGNREADKQEQEYFANHTLR